MKNFIPLFFWILLFQMHGTAQEHEAYSDARVNFFVGSVDEKTNLKIFSFFVLPGEQLPLTLTGSTQLKVEANQGKLESASSDEWIFTPPEKKGCYDVKIFDRITGESMLVHVFVMVPFSQVENGYLNGYQIGDYPTENYKNNVNYKYPKGFVEVTKDNENIYLTPHFMLRQFLCKQSSGWPKYVVVKPRMLRKLELILEKLNESGAEAKTFFLMSAYRTPFYNKSIGNVKFSRHIYGDAIDMYVDDNHDGRIDDLNKDGKIDIKDAKAIAKVVDDIERQHQYKEFIGGMGVYNKTSNHTYFVHVDTRGYRARW